MAVTIVAASLLLISLACGAASPAHTPADTKAAVPELTPAQPEVPSPLKTALSVVTPTPEATTGPAQIQVSPNPKATSTPFANQTLPTAHLPTQDAQDTQSHESATKQARVQANTRWDPLFSLPPCDESTRLTLPPLAAEDYQVIIPLGPLSPPNHVTPTSRIYYHLNRDTSDGGHGHDRPPLEVDVRAPGNIRVLGINTSTSWVNGVLSYVDHDVLFAPCRDQLYDLIHVSTLNSELAAL